MATSNIPNINLRDWYSQNQVFNLLGFRYRQQLKRFLADHPEIFSITICGRPFYLRSTVDAYLADLVRKGTLNPFDIEKKKIQQVAYDISTDEWLPRCLAIQLFEQDSRRLYDKAEKHLFQLVRTRKIYGTKWFCKIDIIDFLTEGLSIPEVLEKREAIDRAVKLNIKIPDRFWK